MDGQENKKLLGNSRSLGHLVFWQVLTFSGYEGYWFYRNYKHLKIHKNLDVKAGWRTFGFFVLPIIVFLFFAQPFAGKQQPLSAISLLGGWLLPAAIFLFFWFLQIRTIQKYASEARCSPTFSPIQLTLIFSAFVIPSSIINVWPEDQSTFSIIMAAEAYYVS